MGDLGKGMAWLVLTFAAVPVAVGNVADSATCQEVVRTDRNLVKMIKGEILWEKCLAGRASDDECLAGVQAMSASLDAIYDDTARAFFMPGEGDVLRSDPSRFADMLEQFDEACVNSNLAENYPRAKAEIDARLKLLDLIYLR